MQAGQMINNYAANAPASSVSSNTIASGMSPYMNQYVDAGAGKPQLTADGRQRRPDRRTRPTLRRPARAPIGDARTGIEQAINAGLPLERRIARG
jgi:hypothetical protein